MMGYLLDWKVDPDKKGLVIVGARQIGKTHIIDRSGICMRIVINIGMDPVAIEVKSGSNRASGSLKKPMTNERYDIYPFTRFIRFEPGNIRVDDMGVEHYPLSEGFRDIELRSFVIVDDEVQDVRDVL